MNPKSTNLLLASALIVMLSACSGQGDPSAPAVTARPDSAPPAAAAAVKAESVVANGPNTLEVKPGQVYACEGRDRTTSTVSWSSTDAAVKGVSIKVQAPEDLEPKVFTKGGSEGSAETGNWVVGGAKFFMVDSDTDAELASLEIKSLPCQ